MGKNKVNNQIFEQANSARSSSSAVCCGDVEAPLPAVLHKTKLEKTQSLLTVISTSIGLVGVAGSVFAFGLSTFYTGTVEVRPGSDSTDVVVKVYTQEGHESVYHTKHIELMPGAYHLEISSTDGRVVQADTKIRFHKTSTVPVYFGNSGSQVGSAKSNALAQSFLGQAHSEIATTVNTNSKTQALMSLNTLADQKQMAGAGSANAMSAATGSATSTGSAADSVRTGKSEAAAKSAAQIVSKKHRWWQFWKHPIVDFGDAEDKQ